MFLYTSIKLVCFTLEILYWIRLVIQKLLKIKERKEQAKESYYYFVTNIL